MARKRRTRAARKELAHRREARHPAVLAADCCDFRVLGTGCAELAIIAIATANSAAFGPPSGPAAGAEANSASDDKTDGRTDSGSQAETKSANDANVRLIEAQGRDLVAKSDHACRPSPSLTARCRACGP